MEDCVFENKISSDVYCELTAATNCDKTKCPMWVTMKLLEKEKGGACE